MRRTSESGMTILEVTIAAAVLAIALFGLIAAMSVLYMNSGVSDDSQIAVQALRRKVEDMRATPDFTLFFQTWGGHTFNVPGLKTPSTGGPMGTVTFLTERQARDYFTVGAAPALVDLDGDGVFDETSPAVAGWKNYAVKVTLTWHDKIDSRSDANQDRTMDVVTVMFDPGS